MKKLIIASCFATILLMAPLTTSTKSNSIMCKYHNVGNDPDGPWKGGLDDPTDWASLTRGIGWLFFLTAYVIENDIRNFENPLQLIPWLFWCGYMLLPALINFAEAFDIWDKPISDGC